MYTPPTLKQIAAALLLASMSATGVSAYNTSYYASGSVLAEGRWVKIKVTETGMCQITPEQLEAWGFDDPSKISVWGYGGVSLTAGKLYTSLPDDLPQQPTMLADGRVIFYGEANHKPTMGYATIVSHLRNLYSDGGFYLITDSRPVKSPDVVPYTLTDDAPIVDNHLRVSFTDENEQNPASAGAHFFGQSWTGDMTQRFTLDLTDYCAGTNHSIKWGVVLAADAQVGLNFKYGTADQSFTRKPSATDVCKYFITANNFEMNYDSSFGNSHEAVVKATPSDECSFVATDYWYSSYPAYSRLGSRAQAVMLYPVMNLQTRYAVNNARQTTRVWDVTDPVKVTELETRFEYGPSQMLYGVGTFHTFTFNSPGRIAAFNPEMEMNPVTYAGEVSNSDLHGSSTPEMLIVSTATCREAAERLAELHRSRQSLDVRVVSQEDVFNEFSSGTPDPMALRRLCRMYYDRGGNRLKYLLLFGAGSYDNCGYVHSFKQSDDLLLTYVVSDTDISGTTTSSYTCDAYFGIMDDSSGQMQLTSPMNISVGRIPAINGALASEFVDKIESYFDAEPDPEMYLSALVLADDGDANGHLYQQEEVVEQIHALSPATTTYKIYDNIYPVNAKDGKATGARAATIERLMAGTGYYTYAGHGHNSAFTGTELWTSSLAKSTTYERYPFAMLATCDAYGFDRMSDGIGYNMLMSHNGGVIGLIGACRTVFKDHNHTLAMAVTKAYFGNDAVTMGDVYRQAYNSIMTTSSSGTQLKYNTACYNFGGDPALPLHRFTRGATVDAVNGVSGDDMHMQPLKFNTVAGSILAADGSVDTSFDGEATVTVYERPRSQRTLSQGDSKVQGDALIYVEFDEHRLASVKVPVKAGRFEAEMYLPITRNAINEDDPRLNRITVSAIETGSHEMAAGVIPGVIVDEVDPDDTDAGTEPVITEMYLNEPGFVDGSEVGETVTLYATVDPGDTGLRTSNSSIAAPMSLKLDGTSSVTGITTAYRLGADGLVTVKLPVTGLTDGRHSLTLVASSANGINASRTINFTVINGSAVATLAVEETAAETGATFTLSHNLSYEMTGRLVIEDGHGKVVRTVADCAFPYTWDLKDALGEAVADGTYRAYAIVSGGSSYTSTRPVTVTVLR